MKNQNVFERVVALLNETIDVLLRGENPPHSPIPPASTGAHIRDYRRHAERLRSGEAEAIFKNLYTDEQLADILDNAVKRDLIRLETRKSFFRLGREIGRLIHEDAAESRRAFEWVFEDTCRQAEEQGPDSEAAARYRQLEFIDRFARICKTESRRPKKKPGAQPAADPLRRVPMIPAQVLEEAPAGEEIIAIPPDHGAGFRRMLIRIGFGPSSWVGSFVRGLQPVSTMSIMPDREHFFVSACGAGYIIHLESRTLVERLGTEVVGVMRDPLMTFFVVNHNNVSLEAFGVATRLWKTAPLGAGRLRNVALMEDQLVGEALQTSGEWTGFSIHVATGEVRMEGAG